MVAARTCLIASTLLVGGCMQDMASQPAYRPLRESTFFRDGRSARPQVDGTIARGQLRDDPHRFEGKQPKGAAAPKVAALVGAEALQPAIPVLPGAQPFAETFPMPVSLKLLERGRERFNIYCAVCHDRTGSGNGMIVQRGYAKPPSYHTDRLRNAPVGYFFDVITRGYGAMPDYASQVPPDDRWAIIAYIRALQRAQNATIDDVPEAERAKLKEAP
jgi:mono/diheme cytochrome c family protein